MRKQAECSSGYILLLHELRVDEQIVGSASTFFFVSKVVEINVSCKVDPGSICLATTDVLGGPTEVGVVLTYQSDVSPIRGLCGYPAVKYSIVHFVS